MTNQEVLEKIKKAKVRLQLKSSFFSYLALYLKFEESDKLPEESGMGVMIDGTLLYKVSFVQGLTIQELEGVIAHEILHLALLHLLRLKNRNMYVWNIATDLAVNSLLQSNKFVLPKGCLIAEEYGDFKVGNYGKIEGVKDKTAEQLYDELYRLIPKEEQSGEGSSEEKGGSKKIKGFDKHDYGEGKQEDNKKELTEEWVDRTNQAYVTSKQKGDTPSGIEKLVGKLLESKINWKMLLQKYVQNLIPVDYTYAKPNKKSVCVGVYLPDIYKEKINVCVCIDTSGSIGQEELTEFLTEIVSLARVYQTRIDMRLLTHDTEIHDDYIVRNGNVSKIMALKFNGGGGTSHKSVCDFIDKQVRDCRAVLFLTDGYSDLNEIDFKKKYRFEPIFVISKKGNAYQVGNEGKIIKLEE